jgi:pimeloyl-ACP methyl ester carboxylesterase
MNGLETILLRNRLAHAGFAPSVFRYPSTRADIGQVASALAAHLRGFGDGPVHVVGHSLGGLVILEAFETCAQLPPGRAVLLGSPVQGSRAARAVAAWALGPQLLGQLAAVELTRCEPRAWRARRELGIIAGSRSAGMGRLFAELPVPNDGTVSVDETQIAGASDSAILDVSHTGMLLSAQVAAAVVAFMRNGRFGPDAAATG